MIGGEGGIGLRRQQSRQHDPGAGRGQPCQRRGKALQRPQQNIGKDEIAAPARADSPRCDAVGLEHFDQSAGTVEPRIGARGPHGIVVDIDRQHRPAQGARGGDRQHTRAGADVEDFLRTAPFAKRLTNPVERDEAPPGGAVMTGAEGERRLDLDADAVRRNPRAVVGAVHDEAAGRHRRQAGETLPHPVGGGDALEPQRRGRVPGRRRGQRPGRALVRRDAEIDRHPPAAVTAIHKAGGDVVGGEALGKDIRNTARRLFIGFEQRDARCVVIGGT